MHGFCINPRGIGYIECIFMQNGGAFMHCQGIDTLGGLTKWVRWGKIVTVMGMEKGNKAPRLRWYGVIAADTKDLLDYVQGYTPGQAAAKVRAEVRAECELVAIPAECIHDGIRVPGRWVSALEYGPEIEGLYPDMPEWEEYQRHLDKLTEVPGSIVDWVRVSALDEWAPVTMPKH